MDGKLVSATLRSMKSDKDNLYDHLCQIATILPNLKPPIHPLQHFEAISNHLKKHLFKGEEPHSEDQLSRMMLDIKKNPAWLIKEEAILAAKTNSNSNKCVISSLKEQTRMLFRHAGIDFGETESVRIDISLNRLAARTGATSLRFWGKYLTKGSDYLVAQGMATESGKSEDPTVEPYKTGANSWSFWVTHDPCDDWQELPPVTSAQIRSSRLIKNILTGNLNQPITSYPPFPGQEKHLLKAQLVRITHNCEISPKGFLAPLEETPDQVDFSEDPKVPELTELMNVENWVHSNPYLLLQGRASYYIDPAIPEDQRQEQLAKLAETDPKIDRLRGINQDKAGERMGLEGCWIIRTLGNPQVFNKVGKQEGSTTSYGVVMLKNPHWPGWCTVAGAGVFGSIYIGHGIKITQPPFSPLFPADLQGEPEDEEGFPEPNPKDPPDELQPDSDEDKKPVQ